ncbi:DAPG hydrolase family protein [Streptomyces sp. DT193]|uniref:DAPG hydrolase family protein n=1 Tax=Streptomyces sp. DT193 TaxID=3393418 RepID=UPI003CFBB2D5
MRYELSTADRAALPDSYVRQPRYLKYRDADQAKPYAKYFRAATRPVPEHVVHALVGGMAPAEYGYGVEEAADRITRPGYEHLESGWTRLSSGVVMVGVLTPMPGVTAEMWDWWFGRHSTESARCKLWFPDAHQYAALGEDRGADRTLTDRQRYVGNVSHVDEYIGGRLQKLAIRFLDPEKMGILASSGSTHICARVTLSTHPVAIGRLIHQVRPTDDGAEMRSRFFLNDTGILDLPTRSLSPSADGRALASPMGRRIGRTALPVLAPRLMPSTLGTDMLHHCASEMNHLAGFLPQLYEEFRGTP